MYRKSGKSSIESKSDVYYHSPDNRKFRSSRQIQQQLDISSDKTSLTLESFTFIRQPIGMDDQSKELIRYARSIKSKVIKTNCLCRK